MTKELIEAADDHQQVAPGDPDDYCRSCAESWPCVTRSLADALEATTRVPVQGEPNARVVTRSLDSDCALGVCMKGCSHLMWACDSCSSEGGWGATRDKLKEWAAEHVCPPPQPVQGEPNDGQEVTDAEAFKQYPARDNFGVPDLRVFAFKAGAEWAFSRATVPDAATEREIAIIEEHREKWMARAFSAETERDAARKIIESHTCGENVELAYRRAIEAQRDRDAALAAIERVRAAKFEVDSVHQIHGTDCLCGFSSARSRSRTEHITEAMVAALDGAPEPELPETGNERRDDDGDLVTSGAHLKVLHQGGYVCDTCINALGLNVRWDHAVLRETHTPLPVEGESKP